MDDEALDTIQTLLTSVLERVDDEQLQYKLRTALQLLIAHEENLQDLQKAANENPELKEQLQTLGYLD